MWGVDWALQALVSSVGLKPPLGQLGHYYLHLLQCIEGEALDGPFSVPAGMRGADDITLPSAAGPHQGAEVKPPVCPKS